MGNASPYSLRGIAENVAAGAQAVTSRFFAPVGYRPATTAPAPAPAAPAPPPQLGGVNLGAIRRREEAAGMKDGGPIKGKGGPTEDNIPIMASKGEFMVKAKAVKKLGVPFMHKLNAIADGKDEPAAKPKGLGARKMAKGGLVDEIPTDGYPKVAVNNPVTGSEVSRNVGNTLMALPGAAPALGALRTLAPATQAGQAVGTAAGAAGQVGAAVAPVGVPAAAATALGVAASPAPESQAPVALGAQRPPTAPAAAPVAATPAPTTVMGAGATRVDGSSSPLFSNAPAADNASLMARGAVSPQNQGALNGIQARQDAGDAARAAKSQFDQQVAEAAATNRAGGFGTGEVNPDPRAAVVGQLAGKRLTARGAGVLANIAATDAAATNATANTKIAQERLGIEKGTARADQAGKQQLLDAQTAYSKAAAGGDVKEMVRAENVLRAVQGKYEREIPNKFTVVPGGQEIVDGQIVRTPSTVLDNQTGQFVQQTGAVRKPAIAEGSISTVNGKTAKYIGGQWVPQ